jgi:hypothetical protein
VVGTPHATSWPARRSATTASRGIFSSASRRTARWLRCGRGGKPSRLGGPRSRTEDRRRCLHG